MLRLIKDFHLDTGNPEKNTVKLGQSLEQGSGIKAQFTGTGSSIGQNDQGLLLNIRDVAMFRELGIELFAQQMGQSS